MLNDAKFCIYCGKPVIILTPEVPAPVAEPEPEPAPVSVPEPESEPILAIALTFIVLPLVSALRLDIPETLIV